MVARKEVWARQPNGSRGATGALRISMFSNRLVGAPRDDASREVCNRTRSTFPVVMYASAPLLARPRPVPDSIVAMSSLLIMAESISLLVPVKNVLLDHGARRGGCLVQTLGASTVRGASCVSLGIRGCHHDIGLRLRNLFGDRPRRTTTL